MNITFNKLENSDYKRYCNDIKEISSIAVIKTFGSP